MNMSRLNVMLSFITKIGEREIMESCIDRGELVIDNSNKEVGSNI